MALDKTIKEAVKSAIRDSKQSEQLANKLLACEAVISGQRAS